MIDDTEERTAMAPPRANGNGELDLGALQVLLDRIDEKYHAVQVWLFGSRARGDARPDSDWDLFVVVPDDTKDCDMDVRTAFRLQRGSGVRADVIPCRASDFRDARDTVNTLSYVVANGGVLIPLKSYGCAGKRSGS